MALAWLKMVCCCCVSKGTVQDGGSGEFASIRASSGGGCANPYFLEQPVPAALAEAGMSAAQWQALLDAANTAVRFEWNPITCCGTWCLCCFAHHKGIKPRMRALAVRLDSHGGGLSLPAGVRARYQMQWKRQIASAGEFGGGATEGVYHCILFFSRCNAPPEMQLMDRKLDEDSTVRTRGHAASAAHAFPLGAMSDDGDTAAL